MNQQIAVAQRRRVPATRREDMALIELDNRKPLANFEELCGLPQIHEYDLDRRSVLRPSQYQPEKIRGELMIEGYECTLMKMPNPQDVADIQSIIVKALAGCSEQGARGHLGLLIGAYPNARPHDPEVYASMLLFDVMHLRIPDAVVAATCMEIRRSKIFVPTIAEFVEAAKNIWAKWRHYERRLDYIEQRRAERIKAVAIVQSHLEWARNNPKPDTAEDDLPFGAKDAT